MPTLKRKKLCGSLRSKGFAEREGGSHMVYHLWVDGKDRGIKTTVSRGTAYKTLGAPLVAAIRRQLCLETFEELEELVQCPLTKDGYAALLRQRGCIT